jgi:hypothetical protein
MSRSKKENPQAKAAELIQRSAALLAAGKLDEAAELSAQATQLLKQLQSAAKEKAPVAQHAPIIEAKLEKSESARSVAAASLGELGVPVSPRALTEYAQIRFGRLLDARALASMRRDEQKAWSSPRAARVAYIVPALEGRRFFAMRGKLALSDWPLEKRILGPWSERADHLRVTLQLAKQYEWLTKVEPDVAKRLAALAASYAETVPGAITKEKTLVPSQVEQAVNAELEGLGPKDTAWREDAAARARQILDEKQQLWGAPMPEIIDGSGD